MKYLLIILLAFTGCSLFVAAQTTDEAALDARVRDFSRQLRCLVCQNETLADSQAMLAIDLKREIREQMKAGKSDREILAYLTARYGDFVSYRPPVKLSTYLLWFGPFILLACGFFILFIYIKNRREQIKEEPLSAAEHQRARELLQASSGKDAA
jgi:cytochrome c-type biogenesis protein CcmH